MGFSDSYLGRLRQVIGDRLVLMPAARIVIEADDGRVLLEERADFRRWGLPGGAPEEGDDIVAAIRREVAEETGLTVEDPRPFGFACDPAFESITYPNGHRCHYFSLMFYARRFSGTLEPVDGENLQLAWFDPHDLPDMLPNLRRSVEAYLRFKASGEFQMI